ncbi:MAG: hypothetical protein MPJ50_04975 [Pirellulales bacterium]|nr:hypothetical protein [Pirellulales bacterium]
MMRRATAWLGLLGVAMIALSTSRMEASEDVKETIRWKTDYRVAMRSAREQQKMLFVLFSDPANANVAEAYLENSLAEELTPELREKYVWLRLDTDAAIEVDGERTVLLNHAAFADMQGREGVAIIDLENTEAKYYGYVVSQFPFRPGTYYGRHKTRVILNLPPGTLTQRTMTFAVRIHPESPQSTLGEQSEVLLAEAESQSRYQAQIGVQGHHSWDSRFHRINARLPGGLRSQEVVAESWPGKNLVDACIDCVDSWRYSSGHWGAVRRRQPLFGYDIKRGRNGIWYATGIFGNRGG